MLDIVLMSMRYQLFLDWLNMGSIRMISTYLLMYHWLKWKIIFVVWFVSMILWQKLNCNTIEMLFFVSYDALAQKIRSPKQVRWFFFAWSAVKVNHCTYCLHLLRYLLFNISIERVCVTEVMNWLPRKLSIQRQWLLRYSVSHLPFLLLRKG